MAVLRSIAVHPRDKLGVHPSSSVLTLNLKISCSSDLEIPRWPFPSQIWLDLASLTSATNLSLRNSRVDLKFHRYGQDVAAT